MLMENTHYMLGKGDSLLKIGISGYNLIQLTMTNTETPHSFKSKTRLKAKNNLFR